MKLLFKKLDQRAVIPTRAYASAGWDLYAIESLSFFTGVTVRVQTGLSVKIPAGHVGLIWDRSSLGSKGITVLAGCIDCDYVGHVQVVLHNASSNHHMIAPGDKIAQLLIVPIPDLTVEEVNELPATERGERGFGSSDKERQNG